MITIFCNSSFKIDAGKIKFLNEKQRNWTYIYYRLHWIAVDKLWFIACQNKRIVNEDVNLRGRRNKLKSYHFDLAQHSSK